MLDISTNSLYKEVIMEHSKQPKNTKFNDSLPVYSIKNPTCGDSVSIQLDIENNVIKQVNQKCIGCAISTASSSMLSELIKGKTVKEAKEIIDEFVKHVKGEEIKESTDLGDAISLGGVADYPARFKCATISWELLLSALNKNNN